MVDTQNRLAGPTSPMYIVSSNGKLHTTLVIEEGWVTMTPTETNQQQEQEKYPGSRLNKSKLRLLSHLQPTAGDNVKGMCPRRKTFLVQPNVDQERRASS